MNKPDYTYEAEMVERLKNWNKRKRVYIAGPITGVKGYEQKFNKAAEQIRALGLVPMNPIQAGIVEGADYKYYIDRGLQLLMASDVVVLLPGWRNSKGARLEKQYARAVGIPVVEVAI